LIRVGKCKVCKSKYRNLIETLHTKGFNPQKIYDYLQSLSDPDEKAIIIKEDIKPSAIRRHIDRHYDAQEKKVIESTSTQTRIEKARNDYKEGRDITINKVNAISMQIDIALAKMESLDNMSNEAMNHKLTISYMNTIKGLIETLGKLTGELKQEGTIDVNFFGDEITKFAEIVVLTIRSADNRLGLNGELENVFSEEFKKRWDSYIDVQHKKLNKELPLDYGNNEFNVNTFNDNS
jgi:hypothetical protein